jgi:hypothetical protein
MTHALACVREKKYPCQLLPEYVGAREAQLGENEGISFDKPNPWKPTRK